MVRSRRPLKGQVRVAQNTDKRIRRRQDRWRKHYWLKHNWGIPLWKMSHVSDSENFDLMPTTEICSR